MSNFAPHAVFIIILNRGFGDSILMCKDCDSKLTVHPGVECCKTFFSYSLLFCSGLNAICEKGLGPVPLKHEGLVIYGFRNKLVCLSKPVRD
jgi:hypothetical protein